MNIKLKIKLTYPQIIKMIYGLLIVVFIIVSYWLVGFLNKNLYQVIIQSEDIIILKKEVATEIVDAAEFEKILNHLNEKQVVPGFEIKEVKDIFSDSKTKTTTDSMETEPPSEDITVL